MGLDQLYYHKIENLLPKFKFMLKIIHLCNHNSIKMGFKIFFHKRFHSPSNEKVEIWAFNNYFVVWHNNRNKNKITSNFNVNKFTTQNNHSYNSLQQ